MDCMRKWNTGTYDNGRWRIKGSKIKKTVRELSELFGEEIPRGKIASMPYWHKYLAMLRDEEHTSKRQSSPLQLRIESIERLIAQHQAMGLDCQYLETEKARCINVPAHDIDNEDEPFVSQVV